MSDESAQPVPVAASRFDATGDARVDAAIAGLPDPQAHRHPVDVPSDGDESGAHSSLPDPALLDEHIADVSAVHRELQRRLSDLSG